MVPEIPDQAWRAKAEDGSMALAVDVSLACRVLLGAVFAVSVISKVRGPAAWQSYSDWLRGMPLQPLSGPAAPVLLVLAEVAVVGLVASPFPVAGLVAGALLSLALTLGLAAAIRRGSWQPCHCFGTSSEPLSPQHVIRNGLLFTLAVTGLATAVSASAAAWPAGAQAGLAAIGGLAAAVLVIFFSDIADLVVPVSGRHG
jgi:methylamine utilization protein MauE